MGKDLVLLLPSLVTLNGASPRALVICLLVHDLVTQSLLVPLVLPASQLFSQGLYVYPRVRCCWGWEWH